MQHPPTVPAHDDDNDDDSPFAHLRAALRELERPSVPIPISVGTMVIARPQPATMPDRPSPPAPIRVVVRNEPVVQRAAIVRSVPVARSTPRPIAAPPSRPRTYRTYEGNDLVDTRPFRRGAKPSNRLPLGSLFALTLVAVLVALATSVAMDYVGVDGSPKTARFQ